MRHGLRNERLRLLTKASAQRKELTISETAIRPILDEMLKKYEADGLPKAHGREYVTLHFQRFLETLEFVPRVSSKLTVLDIGIHGGYLAILIKRLFGFKIFGIDIERNESMVWRRLLESEGINVEICDLTSESIPFDGEFFDLVLFCEVLEHLATDPNKVFKEINRVLRASGTLIFTTPNLKSLGNRLWLLFGRNFMSWDHFRIYSLDECLKLLEENGFKIERFYFWNETYPEIYKRLLIQPLHEIKPDLKNSLFFKAKKVFKILARKR